jgi:uncharacterized membrane protein YdjX (TVP38/TMEM64 family)
MAGSFHAQGGFSTKKSKNPHQHVRSRKGTGLILLLAAGALALARWKLGAGFEPHAVVAMLRGLGSQPAAVPVFLLLYLVGTTLMLPAVGFHVVAAVVWGFWPGLAASMLALNLVSNGQFWLGRWVGRAKVQAWLERRGWGGAVLRNSSISTMIAVRQLPLPFVAVNVAAGASPLTAWQFAIGSGLGALPPTLVYTWFATALIDGVEGARGEALIKALAGGAGVLLIVVASKAWGRWRSRRPVRTG